MLRVGSVQMTDVVAGRATIPQRYPFEIVLEMENNQPSIRVLPGSVSQLLPSNIFSKHSVSNGINYVKLKCNSSEHDVTSAIIVVDASPAPPNKSQPNTPPPESWAILGLVKVDSGSGSDAPTVEIFQIIRSNLYAVLSVQFLESKSVPLGQEPFVRWWRWRVSETIPYWEEYNEDYY